MDALQLFKRTLRDFDPFHDTQRRTKTGFVSPPFFAGDSAIHTTTTADEVAKLKKDILALHDQRKQYQQVTDSIVRERELHLRQQQKQELIVEQAKRNELEAKLKAAEATTSAAQAELYKLEATLKAAKVAKRKQAALLREMGRRELQLRTKLGDTRRTGEDLEAQKTDITRHRDGLQYQLAAITSERDTLVAKLVDVEQDLRVKTANLSHAAAVIGTAHRDIVSLREQLSQRDALMARAAREHFSVVQELEIVLVCSQDVEKRLEAKEDALADAERAGREQATAFSEQLEQLRSLLLEANSTIALQAEQIKALTQERDEYNARAEASAAQTRKANADKDALAQQLTLSQQDVTASVLIIKELTEATEFLEGQLAAHRDAETEARCELEATKARLELMVDELAVLRDKCDYAREENHSIRRELEASNARIELLIDERDTMKANLATAQVEIDGMRSELEAIRVVHDAARHELVAATARGELVLDERDALRGDVERLRQEKALLAGLRSSAEHSRKRRRITDEEDAKPEDVPKAPPCKKAKLDGATEEASMVIAVIPALDNDFNVNAAPFGACAAVKYSSGLLDGGDRYPELVEADAITASNSSLYWLV